MDTKTFVNQLSQITAALLAMTPAQREIVHQKIQTSQAEITVIEMIQPMFDHLSQCPHCHSTHLKNGGKQKKFKGIIVKIAIRALITRQKYLSLSYIRVIYGQNMHDVWNSN